MKKNYLIIIFTLWSINFYCQSNTSDPAYKNPNNQNYTGDVNNTGVNASKAVDAKLNATSKETDDIEIPEGWNELLKKAQIAEEREKQEQHKNDSIKKQLEFKSKLALIEKQEAENFKNKMIGYLIGLLVIVILIITLKKLYAITKGKLNFKNKFDFKNLSQKEVLFLSLGIGLLMSILSGSFFYKAKYYRLFKNTSVEVSEDISSFELHEFNYLLASICFILITGIIYFYLSNKTKDISK